jgi:hypothetical protein
MKDRRREGGKRGESIVLKAIVDKTEETHVFLEGFIIKKAGQLYERRDKRRKIKTSSLRATDDFFPKEL